MKKIAALAVALLSPASALTPFTVISGLASDMNIIQRPTELCDVVEAATRRNSYPVNPKSTFKFINFYSFELPEASGINYAKSLAEISARGQGLKNLNPWSGEAFITRTWTHPETPPYIYYVTMREKDNGTEYSSAVEVCIGIVALRP